MVYFKKIGQRAVMSKGEVEGEEGDIVTVL